MLVLTYLFVTIPSPHVLPLLSNFATSFMACLQYFTPCLVSVGATDIVLVLHLIRWLSDLLSRSLPCTATVCAVLCPSRAIFRFLYFLTCSVRARRLVGLQYFCIRTICYTTSHRLCVATILDIFKDSDCGIEGTVNGVVASPHVSSKSLCVPSKASKVAFFAQSLASVPFLRSCLGSLFPPLDRAAYAERPPLGYTVMESSPVAHSHPSTT